jgi:CHASE2 domain-containing sensor protein
MGMALPIGIRLVEKDGPSIIPWVWAVNGACSVLGSVVAWGISLNFGFNAALWTSAAVYLTACFIMFVRKQNSELQAGAEPA